MVFVLKQVCLIAVDIAGYSDSPPPLLHSSDTKYGVRKSAHRLRGKRRIPQKRKNSTTVPGLCREVLKGKAFSLTIIVHISLLNEVLKRFMGSKYVLLSHLMHDNIAMVKGGQV